MCCALCCARARSAACAAAPKQAAKSKDGGSSVFPPSLQSSPENESGERWWWWPQINATRNRRARRKEDLAGRRRTPCMAGACQGRWGLDLQERNDKPAPKCFAAFTTLARRARGLARRCFALRRLFEEPKKPMKKQHGMGRVSIFPHHTHSHASGTRRRTFRARRLSVPARQICRSIEKGSFGKGFRIPCC